MHPQWTMYESVSSVWLWQLVMQKRGDPKWTKHCHIQTHIHRCMFVFILSSRTPEKCVPSLSAEFMTQQKLNLTRWQEINNTVTAGDLLSLQIYTTLHRYIVAVVIVSLCVCYFKRLILTAFSPGVYCLSAIKCFTVYLLPKGVSIYFHHLVFVCQ